MNDEIVKIGLDDVVAATTLGVLRALESRDLNAQRVPAIEFVKNGFFIDFHIIAGGITPALLDRLAGRGLNIPGAPGEFLSGGGG